MVADQIYLNFDSIDDLTADVDKTAAQQAIKQKYGVEVDLGYLGANVKSGVLSATFAKKEHITLSGENKVYSKGAVSIQIDGSILFNINSNVFEEYTFSIPDTDTLSFRTTEDRPINYEGKMVSGTLSFEQGQVYVKAGHKVIINHFEIDAGQDVHDHPINLYFEPTAQPKDNYVILTDDKVKIGTTAQGTVIVNPTPGNKLFSLLRREYKLTPFTGLIPGSDTLVPDERSFMFIGVGEGDTLEIISREAEGKTPLLKNHGGNALLLVSGKLGISIIEGKLDVEPPQSYPKFVDEISNFDLLNSVAFELVSDAPNVQGLTLRTSSSNRFLLLNNNKPIAGNNMGLEVSDSIDTNMLKTSYDLEAKYPAISFEHPQDPFYNEITANMAQTVDQWLRDKPGVEKYLPEIYFFLNQNAQGGLKYMRLGESALDPATAAARPIRDLPPLKIIDHEFVHILDDYVLDQKPVVSTEKSIRGVYNKEALKISSQLYDSPEFQKILNEVDQTEIKITLPEDSGEDPGIAYATQSGDPQLIEEAVSVYKAALIRSIYDGLDSASDKPNIKILSKRLDKLIQDKIGLAPYVFKYRDLSAYGFEGIYTPGFGELSAVYSELPPHIAAKHRSLAQLELDRVMSVNPPIWLKQHEIG